MKNGPIQASERQKVVPLQSFPKVEDANPVRRHLQLALKEGDKPAHQITFQSDTSLYFKCPYHAKVIKMLETISKSIANISA